MLNISFLLYGAIGVAVGVQTLDRKETPKPLRVVAIILIAFAFATANLAALALLSR
jgi:hypothetical protein